MKSVDVHTNIQLRNILFATAFRMLQVLQLICRACRWRITKIRRQSGFGISLDNAFAIDND